MSNSDTLRTFLDVHFTETGFNESYQLIRELRKLHPNSVHIPIVDKRFRIDEFLEENKIPVKGHRAETFTINVVDTAVSKTDVERPIKPRNICGLISFSYKGTDFLLYRVEIDVTNEHGFPGRVKKVFWNFVYDEPLGVDMVSAEVVGKDFIREVYDWMYRPDDKIWVFDQGDWYQDKELTEAVESATWDNVVLEESFAKGLQRDTSTFFSKEEIYKSLGITWKRGILLLGPPGNGKTESLKALIKSTQQKALYVKSFKCCEGAESGIRKIFEHARKFTPCILIIEDIDSMVTEKVKSFFLNEMDGFAQNQGILTIATTNHPERIDDAILNRPSRFDVKYEFALPSEQLRKQFALKWIKKVKETASEAKNLFVRGDDEAIACDVARKTEGWSFAFLKELFVSFLLRYAHDKSLDPTKVFTAEDIEELLFDQISKLGVQILKHESTAQSTPPGSDASSGESHESTPDFVKV